MATPGMCKAIALLALVALGFLVITVALPALIVSSVGGPLAGTVVGLAAALLVTWNDKPGEGNRRVIGTAGALSGFCGGLVSLEFGGLLGVVAGAVTTLVGFVVIFLVMSRLIWK